MRRLKHITVPRDIQAALANHLGAEFQREKQNALRSRRIRYIVVPAVLTALAAVLFALFYHQPN